MRQDQKTLQRVYAYSFTSIYQLYVQKVENKGRTQAELNEVIYWLTGYDHNMLQALIEAHVNLETFFNQAPKLNPNRALIQGVICGVRVEEIEEPMMKDIRYMDKLVDELAKGKALGKILRQPTP